MSARAGGLAALLFGLLICSNAYGALSPGDVPPDDLGATLQGQTVHPSALRGDVVVISFWATWCHYCMQELPVLAGMQAVAAKRGLHMQVVAVDYRESRHTFVRASELLGSKLPSLLITRDASGSIGKPYGVDGSIPVMVMLHRDGTVAHVHIGYDKDKLDDLIAEINQLLAEPLKTSAAAAATSPR